VTYKIILSSRARRALAEQLPEAVAAACHEFIQGPLADNPYRVGKQLGPPHYPAYAARRGDFRVVYDIRETEVAVEVVSIMHRRDTYRTPR
jgi:mRNA interferase RelE/StbE